MFDNKLTNLFIFGCFPARLFIALLAYRVTIVNIDLLPIMGIFGLLIGFGFTYNIIYQRKKVPLVKKFGGRIIDLFIALYF